MSCTNWPACESPSIASGRNESLIEDAVDGFVQALDRGDVDTLVAIAADATLATARSWSYSPLPAY